MADHMTPAEINQAFELSTRISTKADEVLAPLTAAIANWRPEFQGILWNAIAHKARSLATAARTGVGA